MDSPYLKQTVCKVLKIFQYGKYLVAYVLKGKSGVYKEKKASILALFDLHSSCEDLQELLIVLPYLMNCENV